MSSASDPLELVVFSSRGVVAHPLAPGMELVVGRGEEADVTIDDGALSRRHAVFRAGPPLEIEDLGSSNGTVVSRSATQAATSDKTADQRRLTLRSARAALDVGDTVQFGAALVVVRSASPPATSPEPPAAAEASDALLQGFDAIAIAAPLRRVYEEAARVAPMSLPVLVLGETGVGKDVLARFLHFRSPRSSGPFVALNCATLGESLADAALFGHEKGAFTGAHGARPGLFESAHGGTVFLDEVGELPLATQAKLLRTLETSEVQRLGSVRPVRVDVRVVSATNRDLEHAAAQGLFRQDLYYRVNGVALVVPPLRERTCEVAALARRFLDAPSKQLGLTAPPHLTEHAQRALEAYAWPGNVRELRFVLERALAAAGSGPIDVSHLPAHVAAATVPVATTPKVGSGTREEVIAALAACNGHQTRAAEMLGVSRRTLINRMIEYGLPRPRKG